jgi:[protein-PII] uridylyltransferase
VERPDLLMIGALLHDLGKGLPGDHTEVGIELMETIGARLGFPAADVAVLTDMVRHHLLLADVATRRDIDDPGTVQRVAEAVGNVEKLQLLAALTEADSLATGPAAWTGWKADLLTQLVERVVDLIEGNVTTASDAAFPTSAQLERLALPGEVIEGDGTVLTVMTDDRPGLFSRVAGVLAIDGLDVLSAAAYSSDEGRALAEFRVHDPFRETIPWPKVLRNLELALAGRFAVEARVAERAQRYATKRVVSHPTPTTVSFDNGASPTATVIDVHSVDDIGVLYRITRALAELDLDIRSARVQTLGPQVVDAFYVRDRGGRKVEDPDTLSEIERAIIHSLASAR